MKKNSVRITILAFMIFGIAPISCAGQQKPRTPVEKDGITSLGDIDLDKKFLREGFITDELFRVVIISAKDGGNPNMREIQYKAWIRARVSLERILRAANRNYRKTSASGLINLIEKNGVLYKKDTGHKHYEVYYFEIKQKGLKGGLKNIAEQ